MIQNFEINVILKSISQLWSKLFRIIFEKSERVHEKIHNSILITSVIVIAGAKTLRRPNERVRVNLVT